MAKVRGTSSAPIVLGIVGGVIGLPGAICAGACAAGVMSLSGDSALVNEVGNFYLACGIIGAIAAIVFGALSKRFPKIAGFGLLIAAVLSLITLFTFNFISLISAILILIAAILSFVQKKEIIE